MTKKIYPALAVVLSAVLLASAALFADASGLQGRFTSGFTGFGGAGTTLSFSSSSGATIYVSPTGTGSGTSAADPADFFLTMPGLQGGETIMMDGGVYPVIDTVYVWEDISIEGIPGQTIIDCAGMLWNSPCLRFNANVNLSHVRMINYSYGIQVEAGLNANDIHIHSPNYGFPTAIALTDASVDLDLSDSSFSGVTSSGSGGTPNGFGIYSTDSDAAHIYDNQFIHFNAAIQLGASGSTDEVYNNKISKCIKGFQATEQSTRDIYSNKITDCEYGMVFAGAGNTKAYQNLIKRSDYAGMVIVNEPAYVSNVELYENVIDDTRYGIEIANYATAVASDKIYKNEISNAYDAGIYIFGNDDSQIYQNYISSSHDGLRIEPAGHYVPAGTVSTVFENNVIDQPSGDAIFVEDASALIAYNTMVGGGSNGIVSDGTDQSEYFNNVIFDFRGNGFRVTSTGMPSLAYNNSFANPVDFFGAYADLGGNRSENPAFVSPTDYDLSAGSTMIDAGGHYFVTEDYDGVTRKFPDIGAYEY